MLNLILIVYGRNSIPQVIIIIIKNLVIRMAREGTHYWLQDK